MRRVPVGGQSHPLRVWSQGKDDRMTYTLERSDPYDNALREQLQRYGAVNPRILDKQFSPDPPHAVYRVEADGWAVPIATGRQDVRTFTVVADPLGFVSVADVS